MSRMIKNSGKREVLHVWPRGDLYAVSWWNGKQAFDLTKSYLAGGDCAQRTKEGKVTRLHCLNPLGCESSRRSGVFASAGSLFLFFLTREKRRIFASTSNSESSKHVLSIQPFLRVFAETLFGFGGNKQRQQSSW